METYITVKQNMKKKLDYQWGKDKHLRFVNCAVDVLYVLQKVKNIWAEIDVVRNALLPYREYLQCT